MIAACAAIVVLTMAATAIAEPLSKVSDKTIYGDDDRMEVYEVEPGIIRQRAERSVAAMVRNRRVAEDNGRVFIPSQSLGGARELC